MDYTTGGGEKLNQWHLSTLFYKSLKEKAFWKVHTKVDGRLIFYVRFKQIWYFCSLLCKQDMSASFLRYWSLWIPLKLSSAPHYSAEGLIGGTLYFTDWSSPGGRGMVMKRRSKHICSTQDRYIFSLAITIICIFYRQWRQDSGKPKKLSWNHTEHMCLNADLHPALLDSEQQGLSSRGHVHMSHLTAHETLPASSFHQLTNGSLKRRHLQHLPMKPLPP